jgi:hypothetical protein
MSRATEIAEEIKSLAEEIQDDVRTKHGALKYSVIQNVEVARFLAFALETYASSSKQLLTILQVLVLLLITEESDITIQDIQAAVDAVATAVAEAEGVNDV